MKISPLAFVSAALLTALFLKPVVGRAQEAARTGAAGGWTVALNVPAETPLRLYLTERVWFRKGATLQARVIEPVWAFDRVVIPAGTLVEGDVASLESVPGMIRARAILGGDFTPLKRARLSFNTLVFADGRRLPIAVTAAFGLDTIYVRKRTAANATAPAPSTVKGRLKQQARQQYETKRDSFIYFVRGQNKKEWAEEWLLAKLPYHPQLYRARTRVDAILSQPLEFGEATLPAEQVSEFGQLAAQRQFAEVRLLKTVSSSESSVGQPIAGMLTKPIFGTDHALVLPAGTTFNGKVTLSQEAKWFHRGGKLRFAFERLELPMAAQLAPAKPAERPIESQLAGIEANPQSVRLDSEGTAKATESKTRFLRPVIAGLVAAHSADDDADRSHSLGSGSTSSANSNLSGRTLGGFSGFGLLGAAASFGPRAIGASFGYYGFAWSVYSNIIARGKDVVFSKNTAMQIQFGADVRRK